MIISSACYAELALEYPISGSGYTYVINTFGELPAWIVVCFNIISYILGMAANARAFSEYFSALFGKPPNFFTLTFGLTYPPPAPANTTCLDDNILSPEYSLELDYLAAVLVLAITGLLILGSRESTVLISSITVLKLFLAVFVLVVSLTQANGDNLTAPYTTDSGQISEAFAPNGAVGIFTAASAAMFAFFGFDSIANAAEEATSLHDIPFAMLGTSISATILYVLISLGFALMTDWANPSYVAIQSPEFSPFFQNFGGSYFDLSFCLTGLPWMRVFVSLVAIMGIISVIAVSLYSGGRLIMVCSRDWLLPPQLATVSTRTQTPILAQAFLGIMTAIISFVAQDVRIFDLVSLASIVTLWAVINAYLVRRYYPEVKVRYTRYGVVETEALLPKKNKLNMHLKQTTRRVLVAIHLILLNCLSLAVAVTYAVRYVRIGEQVGGNLFRDAIVISFFVLWALLTATMTLLCPVEYTPPKFHIAGWMLPWLPSIAIFILTFSATGLPWTEQTFWFWAAVIVVIILVFYFLFSLPMSYIKHSQLDFINEEATNAVELVYMNGKWIQKSPLDDNYNTSVPKDTDIFKGKTKRTVLLGTSSAWSGSAVVTNTRPVSVTRSMPWQGSTVPPIQENDIEKRT